VYSTEFNRQFKSSPKSKKKEFPEFSQKFPRNFTKATLAQIRHVFPEAIDIECLHSKQYKEGTYALRRVHTVGGISGDTPMSPTKKVNYWSEAEILSRRNEFKKRLYKIVLEHHQVKNDFFHFSFF
jgi:hypothetical protein